MSLNVAPTVFNAFLRFSSAASVCPRYLLALSQIPQVYEGDDGTLALRSLPRGGLACRR